MVPRVATKKPCAERSNVTIILIIKRMMKYMRRTPHFQAGQHIYIYIYIWKQMSCCGDSNKKHLIGDTLTMFTKDC